MKFYILKKELVDYEFRENLYGPFDTREEAGRALPEDTDKLVFTIIACQNPSALTEEESDAVVIQFDLSKRTGQKVSNVNFNEIHKNNREIFFSEKTGSSFDEIMTTVNKDFKE